MAPLLSRATGFNRSWGTAEKMNGRQRRDLRQLVTRRNRSQKRREEADWRKRDWSY